MSPSEVFTSRPYTDLKPHPFSFPFSCFLSLLSPRVAILQSCFSVNLLTSQRKEEKPEYWVSAANGTRTKRAIGKWPFFLFFYHFIGEVFDFPFSPRLSYFFNQW